MSALLIIFAKEPAPGQVKTRLCPPLSLQSAAQLYHAFLTDILEEMSRLPGLDLALAYSPDGARSFFQGLAPSGLRLFPQEGKDLGERMARAFDRGFTAGYRVVLLRGSDTPDLPGTVLLEAREVLESGRAELALGPAADGGYYLVGLNSPHPDLFQRQVWSTDTVLAEALHRARLLGLTVHLARPWRDIDTYADLLAFLARPHPAPEAGWRSHLMARKLVAGLP